MSCKHIITRGRKGEKGSWCVDCGLKIYDVDSRTCDGCVHYRRLPNGSICRKHLMSVSASMHVTFKITEGTCWSPIDAPDSKR